MAFNIPEFTSNALRTGVLKPNLYTVDFEGANAKKVGDSKSLRFFTESVNIPAIDLFTQQIRRFGYGPVEDVAFRPVFTPMSMVFIVEANERNILNNVITAISAVTNFMDYDNMSKNSTSGLPYEVAYKSDYEFNITVDVYNEKENKILKYAFKNCYAKQISGIGLSWAANDAYIKADVIFNYTDFSITSKNPEIKQTNPSITTTLI